MVQWVPERITIFHLYRRDGRELYLHPFDDPQVMLSLRQGVEVVGKYGEEPRMDGVTSFHRQLYAYIDNAVRLWAREQHFMTNFLCAAVLFVALYVLLTLGGLSPLAAWGNAFVSLTAAGILYVYCVRRAEQSEEVEEKREYLRGKVDRIRFFPDEFVKDVEQQLHRSESVHTKKLLESIVAPQEELFASRNIEDGRQMLQYLERKLSARGYKRQERILRKYRRKRGDNASLRFGKLSRVIKREELDLSLFAMYRSLKERFEVSGRTGGRREE